jgi:hypothetical protein
MYLTEEIDYRELEKSDPVFIRLIRQIRVQKTLFTRPTRQKKDAAQVRRPNRQKTRSLGQNYYKSPLVRSPLKTVIIKTFSPARLTFYLCGRINAAPRERRQESAKEQDRGDYHECRQTKQCPVHAPKRFRGILSYKMLFTARCDYLFRHSF